MTNTRPYRQDTRKRNIDDSEATLAYDGSFPGFLCASADALNAKQPAPRVVRNDVPETLFEARIAVPRDDDRAVSVWKRLTIRYGAQTMRTLLEAFLSEKQGVDEAIARLLCKIRWSGATVLDDLADPDSLAVEKASYRARQEGHRFCGLVRFSQLSDGSWYAPIEPECNVLILIADHFTARFNTMRFAIHDQKRGSALVHEPGNTWNIVDGFRLAGCPPEEVEHPVKFTALLSNEELEIRALWKTYFESIAISERNNSRLQMGHMPKKYWHLLTEMGKGITVL